MLPNVTETPKMFNPPETGTASPDVVFTDASATAPEPVTTVVGVGVAVSPFANTTVVGVGVDVGVLVALGQVQEYSS